MRTVAGGRASRRSWRAPTTSSRRYTGARHNAAVDSLSGKAKVPAPTPCALFRNPEALRDFIRKLSGADEAVPAPRQDEEQVVVRGSLDDGEVAAIHGGVSIIDPNRVEILRTGNELTTLVA